MQCYHLIPIDCSDTVTLDPENSDAGDTVSYSNAQAYTASYRADIDQSAALGNLNGRYGGEIKMTIINNMYSPTTPSGDRRLYVRFGKFTGSDGNDTVGVIFSNMQFNMSQPGAQPGQKFVINSGTSFCPTRCGLTN
ncbi:MAG: hypothetical protein H6605_05550 [Flavobacteriales bacterium]|nr:hypothetical protein [Flavobacteriales bacterium]